MSRYLAEGLKCFFENIPYDLQVKYEKYYQLLTESVKAWRDLHGMPAGWLGAT